MPIRVMLKNMDGVEAKIVRRIRAANFGRKATIELIYAHLDAEGHGAIAYSYSGKKTSGVVQVAIPRILGKALLQETKNVCLDGRLRL